MKIPATCLVTLAIASVLTLAERVNALMIEQSAISVTDSSQYTPDPNGPYGENHLIDDSFVDPSVPGGFAHRGATGSLTGPGITCWLDEDCGGPVDPVGNENLGWVQFDFDQSYHINAFRFWNFTDQSLNRYQRSMRRTIINYSNDGGTTWTQLLDFELDPSEFVPFPQPSYSTQGQAVSAGAGGFTANAVLVTAITNWSGTVWPGDGVTIMPEECIVAFDEIKFDIGPPGDFGSNAAGADGVVSGSDFLLWQQNPLVGDLADWEANYGSTLSPLVAAASVPEPTGVVLFGTAVVLLASGRIRHRSILS